MSLDSIRLQFFGATGYVTGSRTLLEYKNTKVYIDAGLYQGPQYIEEKNYKELEHHPSSISAVILTHAHIDHSGLLPLLVKKGFKGKIYCTPATAELLHILLPDAGKIQKEEFKFLSKKKISQYDISEPLYTEEDALETLQYINIVPFHKKIRHEDIDLEFYWAGHILGASYIHINCGEKKILFSGDVGPISPIIHKRRETPPPCDYLIVESTYGARLHENKNFWDEFIKAVEIAIKRKGMLIIPSFAVGRTQTILYILYVLIREKKIIDLPIFIDSPMATRATMIYLDHPEEILETIIENGFYDYLKSKKIFLIEDVDESKRLNFFNGPGIIISASGMCNGGRIRHHLFNRIWDRRNVILFVGYQGEGTLGRMILEGATRVKIFGRDLPVRAAIATINTLSAHADQAGLCQWINSVKESTPPSTIFINHGEDLSRNELKHSLKLPEQTKVIIPRNEESFYL